jgi:hypothetical protein
METTMGSDPAADQPPSEWEAWIETVGTGTLATCCWGWVHIDVEIVSVDHDEGTAWVAGPRGEFRCELYELMPKGEG